MGIFSPRSFIAFSSPIASLTMLPPLLAAAVHPRRVTAAAALPARCLVESDGRRHAVLPSLPSRGCTAAEHALLRARGNAPHGAGSVRVNRAEAIIATRPGPPIQAREGAPAHRRSPPRLTRSVARSA